MTCRPVRSGLAGAVFKRGAGFESVDGGRTAVWTAAAAGARTIGRGTQMGVAYRLADGQLVYVQNPPPQQKSH